MAGAGAKARIANNRAIVRRTRGAAYAAAAVCALFIALRAGAFRYQSTAAAVAKLLVSGAVEAAALWLIARAAAVGLDEAGGIIDAGADLSASGGVLEYCFDVVYLTATVHALAVLAWWPWLLLLAIPGFVMVRLARDVLVPWLTAPAAEGGAAWAPPRGGAKGRVARDAKQQALRGRQPQHR